VRHLPSVSRFTQHAVIAVKLPKAEKTFTRFWRSELYSANIEPQFNFEARRKRESLHVDLSITQNAINCFRSSSHPIDSANYGKVVWSLDEFISYTEDVVVVFHSNSVHHHLFADDKQIYSATSIADTMQLVSVSSAAFYRCIRDWCALRRLQLNAGKTGVLQTSARFHQRTSLCQSVMTSSHRSL